MKELEGITGRATWRQRLTAGLCVLSLHMASAAQAADLSQQMAAMFGGGALANVSGPGAYRSQTQNIYTGGELQLRFPTRSYQFWSYSLPHVNAGCGGADVYLGNFSHISSDQFKDMLESVARSYAGLLFKAALKSINPLIESVIGDLQKTLESYSQANGNSCDMARALLNGTSAVTGMTSESTCIDLAMSQWGDSLAAARLRCKVDQAPTNAAAKASPDPAVRAMADRDLNLVWDALRGSTLADDEKTAFMNIAGTLVIRKPSSNGDVPQTTVEHAPSIDSLAQLLSGDGPGPDADQVQINDWLVCDDLPPAGPGDCLAPVRGPLTIKPFTTQVRQMLEGIRDAVVQRRPLNVVQVRFINMTRVPVYRMLAAGYTGDSASRNDELIDLLINRYAKVIAYDYAYAYLRKALKDVRVFLGMARLRNAVEEAQSKRLLANVDRLLEEISTEHLKALGQIREANAVVEDLQRFERELRAGLPGSIRGMLDMSSLMRGSGSRG